MSRWKLISQKSAFRAELFRVKEIVFKNKRGTLKSHHIIEKDPIVCILPLTDSYELYLISEYRYMLDRVLLEAVAGYIKNKETTVAAAKRELQEETGITAHQLEEIARIDTAASVIKSKMHIFLAKSLEIGKSHLEDDEDISLVKITLDLAVEKVMSGEISDTASVIGILMLDKLRSQKKL